MNVQSANRRPALTPKVATKLAPIRVLLVDDDDSVLETLGFLLRSAGYEVRISRDAMEAAHLVPGSPPDVVIVDLHLRYLSGCEFIASMRADGTIPFIPVIFLAEHADVAERTRESGSVCLLKPVDPVKLLAAVASCTSPQRPHAQAAAWRAAATVSWRIPS